MTHIEKSLTRKLVEFTKRPSNIKATAELQVIPIGEGITVRQEVMRVVERLPGYDFILETHAAARWILSRVL